MQTRLCHAYTVPIGQQLLVDRRTSRPVWFNCFCSKGSVPYWSNPPVLIFDIRALWRSGVSARAPECQKLKMVGQTSVAKSKVLTGSAVKGLNGYLLPSRFAASLSYSCSSRHVAVTDFPPAPCLPFFTFSFHRYKFSPKVSDRSDRK